MFRKLVAKEKVRAEDIGSYAFSYLLEQLKKQTSSNQSLEDQI